MDNAVREKFIEGYVECLCDTRFVCGKTDGAEFRFYMKEVLSNSDLFVDASPDEIQFYIGYVTIPVEQRRELVSEFIKNNAELVMDMTLPLFFKGLSCIVSGEFTLAEVNEQLKQLCPPELCDMAMKKITEALGLNEVFKLEPRDLGLLAGSVAGADERLRTVLDQRSVRRNENGSHYEQDLASALWECSEGKNLDEFMKMLGDKHYPTEVMARVREIARTACLRIIRKTIEDLPDIHQDVKELRNPGREIPLTEELLTNVPSKYDDLAEPSPTDLLEHIGITRANTSETEWQVFMMLSQKVLDGELEVGSKTGLSISAALGKDASRVRKTISRYRERQLNC